jgi:hypothetical protein
MLPLAHRLECLVERGDPIEGKAGSAAVGEKIAGEDVIVLVVFDQQYPDLPVADQRGGTPGSSTISIQ